MNDNLRQRFLELKVGGQRCAIPQDEKIKKDKELVAFLQTMIQEKQVKDFEGLGFCYWNISDNFAMLREGDRQYNNHVCFYEHIKKGSDLYLYWLVCDATQRLTLEHCGYSDFWWHLYEEAVKKNEDELDYPFVEFHVHRAALYRSPHIGWDEERFCLAQINFEKFLEKTSDSKENIFYKTILMSMVYKSSFENIKALLDCCEYLFQGLSHPKEQKQFLCGEWKSFITPFNKYKQAVVGIVSCVNTFIDNGDMKEAKLVYEKARELGLFENVYIERRLY